jgi:hypothetical protein
MKWMPEVGKAMNCQLPGELIRAMVVEVVSENICIVQLSMASPISKTHGYILNSVVPCQRKEDEFGNDVWSAVSKAEMRIAEEEDAAHAEEKAEAQKAALARRDAEELARRPKAHAFTVVKAGD